MTAKGRGTRAERTAGLWPERLSVKAAAAMLDMHPATWGKLWPVLAAHYGLKVYRTCGVKFDRRDVLAVTSAHTITLDKRAGVVEVDGRPHPLAGPRRHPLASHRKGLRHARERNLQR